MLLGLLSAAPSLFLGLGEPFAQWVPAGASIFGLTLLPWLALAGLPLGTRAVQAPDWKLAQTLFPVAACLPSLGLAAGLDLVQGRLELSTEAAWPFLFGGPLLVLVWRLSAVSGRSCRRASLGHGLLWGLLLPLSTAFVCALDWAPPPAGAPGPPMAAAWRMFNPLLWCLERTGHAAQWAAPASEWGAWAFLLGSATLSLGVVRALGGRPGA